MRVFVNRDPHDSGAVAIMVALLAVVLIGLSAFTLDFGMAYSQRRALSTGADSAALAIVRNNYEKVIKDPNLICSQLEATGESAAQTTALTQVNANKPFNMTLPASALDTDVLSCVGANGGVLQATVTVSKQVDTIFGGLFGVSTLNISRTAAAALGAANDVSGYLPIAVCTNEAQEIIKNAAADAAAGVGPRHEKIELDKVWKSGNPCNTDGSGSGNWGWLDCKSLGSGTPALAQAIPNGCPDPITLQPGPPAYLFLEGMTGAKGNSNAVSDAISGIMDDKVAIPVYDTYTDTGTKTKYRIIGFLSVKLCGYAANKEATPGACYLDGIETLADPDEDVSLGKKSNALQVQFVKYTPAGNVSDLCAIGDKTCSFNAYVTKLIK